MIHGKIFSIARRGTKGRETVEWGTSGKLMKKVALESTDGWHRAGGWGDSANRKKELKRTPATESFCLKYRVW